MNRTILTLLFILLALPVLAQDAREGRALFERYCAACHGLGADGQGPMRPVLMVPPSDLTRLSAEGEGVFPLFRVVRRIDGRDPLVSHGSEMPVYGDFFEGETQMLKTEAGQPIHTSAPVADLVAYLQSLQGD